MSITGVNNNTYVSATELNAQNMQCFYEQDRIDDMFGSTKNAPLLQIGLDGEGGIFGGTSDYTSAKTIFNAANA